MSASIGMTDTSSASAAPLSDIPPDITQLGLKIYPFVSAVDAQRIYAKLRDEVTDLKAKLSKTSKDLNHVGHELDQMVKKNTKLDDELDQMVKKNAKLDDELKIIQIDKQSLAKRLDLAMLAASESKTTKNDDAFIAIEGELKEYKKELSVAKEQLRLAHKKVFEAKLHIETLAEEKRVIELSNTKLVARNKRWDDHTHEEQLQLQEQRNDLKKQQDFLTQYERSLIDKGYKLEDQEEKIFKKEQELTRRTKEMEKKSSDLIDMEKRLKGKEKYLTEWSFELTHKQETADQEKSALRIKQQEYRELQDALAQSEASMKLSQERFLKFTSRPVLSAIAANTSYPKSSDSQETIKFETKFPVSTMRRSSNDDLPPHLRVIVENPRVGFSPPASIRERIDQLRTISIKSGSSSSTEGISGAVSTKLALPPAAFSTTPSAYHRSYFRGQTPEVFYAKPETRNEFAVKAWIKSLEEHGGEVGSTPDDKLINLFRLLADTATVKPWFCKFCLKDHGMEDLRGVIPRYPFSWKALKASFIEEFGSA